MVSTQENIMATYYHPPATHNGKTLDTWHFNSDYTKVDAVYVDDDGENAEDVTWDVN
tara:strand:- start:1001 stop:1171 length:171 start_codon:yes stop_codon:yes gene_type:complete